jgi:hypothetical protein
MNSPLSDNFNPNHFFRFEMRKAAQQKEKEKEQEQEQQAPM